MIANIVKQAICAMMLFLLVGCITVVNDTSPVDLVQGNSAQLESVELYAHETTEQDAGRKIEEPVQEEIPKKIQTTAEQGFNNRNPGLETESFTKTLRYTLHGYNKKMYFTMYTGLNNYLATLPRYYYCDPECPSNKEIILDRLNNAKQKPYLQDFVEAIKKEAITDHNQAKVAISIVQHMPYDWYGLNNNRLNNRYAYEVLHDGTAVCGEKSELLAFLLRELGYGVVLFDFEADNHMALGIKCATQYSYDNSGYCFIESTAPTIITHKPIEYVGGSITSKPEIIEISDGKELAYLDEEYKDAKWLEQLSASGRTVVDSKTYWKWDKIVKKYGLRVEA